MLALIIFTLLFNVTYSQSIKDDLLLGALGGIAPENNAQVNVQTKKNVSNQHFNNQPSPVVETIIVPKGQNFNDVGSRNTARQINDNEEVAPPKIVQNTNDHNAVSNNKMNTPLEESKISITKPNKSTTFPPQLIHGKAKESMQPGAILRSFYVFLGLSVVIMMYFIFRSYRLRRGGQSSTTVRKYGVVARRSDMEMRPLELDDDDDDTLFEIGNQNIVR